MKFCVQLHVAMAVLEDEAAAEDAAESKNLHSLLGGLFTAVAAVIVDAADVSVVLRSLYPLASLLFEVPKNSFSGKSMLIISPLNYHESAWRFYLLN